MGENREYWLGHCEGFDVRAGDRRLGVVEYVRYGSAHDRPDAIFALSGRFRTRVLEVPVADVEELDPDDETVWISDSLAATAPFAPAGLRASLAGLQRWWSRLRSASPANRGHTPSGGPGG
jgi:hypothetical protein